MSEPVTTVFDLSPPEAVREAALRERFAAFWAAAGDDPRATYEAFIGATPILADVELEPVDQAGVKGWWAHPVPARGAAGEAILFLHGGGYWLGSARAYRGLISQIAARTGRPVLALDYPLAPEATLPAAPNAALAAWRWLRAEGFERLAIVGDSAGGGLTLVTLAQLRAAGEQAVAAAVFSPWTDMTLAGPSMTDAATVDPLIGYEYLQQCVAHYLGGYAPADPLASPLFGDLAGLPPLLIQVGGDERLLDDARRYAARAAEAGGEVELEVWTGLHHVFQLDVAHIDSARHALDNTARFLTARFDAA